MKKLVLSLLSLPTALCAELAFDSPYQKFIHGDFLEAFEEYNTILNYKKNLSDLGVFEALLGRSMCAMCVHGKDAALADRIFHQGIKTEDREKYLDTLSKFMGFLRD